MGIVFALVSLLFAGLNDFLFKRYVARGAAGAVGTAAAPGNPARDSLSRGSPGIPDSCGGAAGAGSPLGLFVAGVGVIWAGVFAAGVLVRGERITMEHWPVTLGAGAASAVGNLLFMASFRVFPASTSATVYRLNLVIVAVLSFAWLHEAATPAKLAGIAVGVAAVLAFWRGEAGAAASGAAIAESSGAPAVAPGSAPGRAPGRAAGAAMLAGACVLRAVMGLLYKRSTTLGVAPLEMLTIGGACWIAGGLIYAAVRGEPAPASFRRVGSYCLVNGLLICGIVFFLLAAAALKDASIVIPITQLSFIVTCVLAVRFQGERLNRAKVAGLVFAAACVVLLCWA